MTAIDLDDLDLETVGHPDVDDAEWNVSFPFTTDQPGSTETAVHSGAVVYNTLAPGTHVGSHRDEIDEFVLVLEGTVEATVGGESTTACPEQLLVVPAGITHTVENVGEGTARILGFFGDATVESVFDEPVEPLTDE